MKQSIVIFTIFAICHQAFALPNQPYTPNIRVLSLLDEAEQLISYGKSLSLTDYPSVLGSSQAKDLFKRISGRNDELILSCILSHKENLNAVHENLEKNAGACLKEGKESAIKAIQKIIQLRDRLIEVWNDGKHIIDNCTENNEDATSTLQCIHNSIFDTVNELVELERKLRLALHQTREELREIALKTMHCLEDAGRKSYEELVEVVEDIIECINDGENKQ